MDNLGFTSDLSPKQKNNIYLKDCSENTPSPSHTKPALEVSKRKTISNQPSIDSNEKIFLKKSIGLSTAVGIIFSNVIGSGIFISPQGVLRGSGSVALSLIIWLLCGILSLFGALSYAELGTLIQDSGGTYIYLLEGFAPTRRQKGSQWRAIPAFLYNWQNTFFVKPAAMAIISLTCAEYLVMLSSSTCTKRLDRPLSKVAVKLIAAFILCSVAAINCYSVQFSAHLQKTFAAMKIVAVVMVISGGFWMLDESSLDRLSRGFEGTKSSFKDVASAFYSGLWAFNGWQNLNYVTKEMKNPVRDLPLALIPANALVIVFYLLVNVSYLLVMTKEEVMQSETVAVGFGNHIAGRPGEVIMILLVALSTFGSAASGCFTAGRLCHVAAREGHMMSVLSFIHKDHFTPTSAVIFNLVLGLMMIIPSDIGSLISLTGFTAWIFIGATQVSLLVMRRSLKEKDRAVRVNILIPVIVILFSGFLVITPILNKPSLGHFYVLGFLFLGIIAYIPFVHLRLELPGARCFTLLVQKLLHVVPPQDEFYED